MKDRRLTPDGAYHAALTPREIAAQEAQEREHNALVESMRGGKPMPRKNRVPLYPAGEVHTRTVPASKPSVNTATHQIVAPPDGIPSGLLYSERNRAERYGCFNLEVLTRNKSDKEILLNAGFRLTGTINRIEDNRSVLYQCWRLPVRVGEMLPNRTE